VLEDPRLSHVAEPRLRGRAWFYLFRVRCIRQGVRFDDPIDPGSPAQRPMRDTDDRTNRIGQMG
jgi:hypothetical protein